MRILYFTRDYTTHDRRFVIALVEAGYSVYYLRLERQVLTLEDRPLPPQVEVISWAGGQETVRRSDGPQLLVGLERVLRQVQPDLVQAGPIQTAAFLAALADFHPLVSVSWGSDLLRDAGRSRWNHWATRFTLGRSDALVGDCTPVRLKAMEYGMPAERIVTFPWGVDLEHFYPQAPHTPVGPDLGPASALFEEASNGAEAGERPFVLLSTRSWETVYGVDVIARAFVQAVRQRPELRLVMLGGGSQAGLLRSIFREGQAEGKILFPGQVAQADLPSYYRMADLYVSASHSDGTSISLLEAMACGRPVLVSDIPGNREWVVEGEQGRFFPDGDAAALAAAMVRAAADRLALIEMGRRARLLAEARADWRKNFHQLLKAYQIAMSAAGVPQGSIRQA